ncbi:hypothetical protein ZIOFF_066207 [Zingiber officinale]|uniref:Uncharacterized protein n=1 Tax=Zingiber officinale TaxID=94328 RepID=A0A8J5KHP5_ZINOF|nr:hypothetical protein ZIOFF_066207 [Zingiber officinale]
MFEYYSPSTILSKILESSSINFDENIWDAKHEVIMVQWHIGRIILDMLTMMEEVPPHGVYGDMYHHGYGYAQYSPYPSPGSPVPTLRHNNQLYTSQHYQFQATYFQPPLPTNAPYTSQNPSSKVNISTSTATDVAPTPIDTTQASSNGIAKESTISEEIAKSEANSHVELTDYSTLFGPELKLPDDQWDASYLNVLDVAVIEEGILHVLFGCASQNAPQSLVRAHCALKYILLAIFAHVDDVLAKYKLSFVKIPSATKIRRIPVLSIIFVPLWLFHDVTAQGRFSLPTPSLSHDCHWAPCHAIVEIPLFIAIELLLCIYLHNISVNAGRYINLKILAPPPGQTFDGVEETKFPTSHPLENSETEKFH